MSLFFCDWNVIIPKAVYVTCGTLLLKYITVKLGSGVAGATLIGAFKQNCVLVSVKWPVWGWVVKNVQLQWLMRGPSDRGG